MVHNCIAAPLTAGCFSQRQEHVWLQGQVRPPQLFQDCGHSHTAQALLHQHLQDSSGVPHPSWLKAPPQSPTPHAHVSRVLELCVPTHPQPIATGAPGPSPPDTSTALLQSTFSH